MAADLCPQCGTPRPSDQRFCGSCAFDFWKAAESSPAPPPAPVEQTAPAESTTVPGWNAQPPAGDRRSWGRIALIIVGVIVVLALIGGLMRPTGSGTAGEGLVIVSPEDGEVVDADLVQGSGTAPAGAEIVLDIPFAPDDRTQADEDGEWSLPVELEEGTNTFTFRLGDDEDTETTLHVIYEPAIGGGSSATPRPSETPPEPTPIPTPEPTPAPAFADITLTGVGDAVPVFSIPENSAAIAQITHTGGSNFAVWSLAADGSNNDLLVNTIGGYSGVVLFDEGSGVHSVAFEVTAGGSWTIVIRPVTAARAWNPSAPLNGRGDDVVRITPPISGFASATVQHTGSSNFAIWAYASSGADLLVNEIGSYLGDVLIASGTFLFEVSADGAWTVAPN